MDPDIQHSVAYGHGEGLFRQTVFGKAPAALYRLTFQGNICRSRIPGIFTAQGHLIRPFAFRHFKLIRNSACIRIILDFIAHIAKPRLQRGGIRIPFSVYD